MHDHRQLLLRLALALTLVGVYDCRNNLPNEWLIAGLRVIAVTLDPPTIAPGGTTTANIISVDTQGRTLTTHWLVCPPSTGQIAPTNFLCSSPLALSGDSTQFSLTAPLLPPSFTTVSVALLGDVCAGGNITIDSAGNPSCSGTDSWEFSRTLTVSSVDSNNNPGIASIQLDNAVWPSDSNPTVPVCVPHGTCDHTIQVVVAPGARESYSSSGGDGGVTLTEMLRTHFYVTDGTLADGTLADPTEAITSDMSQTWTATSTLTTVTFWFVLDDGRGGVTELSRQIVVGP